jgi:hypothetical protein
VTKIVYHGHLGHELLHGIGHVLRVWLTASMEIRIEQVRARQNLNEASARRYIEETDKARSRRLMAMFGVDWRDPNRYDLVLNMGKMSIDAAKRIIVETAKLEEYQPTPASGQAFRDLALTSQVHATVITSPYVRGSALEVRAEGGHVHVSGRVEDSLLEDEIVKLIEQVPGVTRVTSNLYAIPPTELP